MTRSRRIKYGFVPAIVLLLILVTGALMANSLFGAGRTKNIPLRQGNLVPDNTRTYTPDPRSPLREAILDYWSSMPFPESHAKIKLQEPRIILACFLTGKRIEEANRHLAGMKPHGVTGSSWLLNPGGDYDFTLLALTPILYFFGDSAEVMYPATREHLLDVLLTAEGGRFDDKVPHSLGLIEDTENHVLMTQGSRYLKNRWMRLHGNDDPAYDNTVNGMEKKLGAYLENILRCGIYEFNSNPYQGYTLSALLNLEAFGSSRIREISRKILDRVNWQYACGSFRFNTFPPMRRRYEHSTDTILDEDYHGAMMRTWVGFYTRSAGLTIKRGMHHALWAAVMPYRPPDGVIDRTLGMPFPYYVKIGHGWNSCPGIYSGSAGYLLSAGGANRGKHSLIIARPVILFTDPADHDLGKVFHMAGPGAGFMSWNNTGVYRNFACAAGPVHIPASATPVLTEGRWNVFRLPGPGLLAVYSTDALGLMVLSGPGDPGEFMAAIRRMNPSAERLKTEFHHPDGDVILYDTHAPHDKWVILEINGKKTNRDFDSWPFFEGQVDC